MRESEIPDDEALFFQKEVCVCGNSLVLDTQQPAFVTRRSPCRCEEPGPGGRTSPCRDLPAGVSRRQFEQRTKLGLPVEADIEKAMRTSWH
jgi:hypothetical protein